MTIYKQYPPQPSLKVGQKTALGNNDYFLWAVNTPETPRYTLKVFLPNNWDKQRFGPLLAWIQGCPEFILYAAKVNMAFKNLNKIARSVFALPKDWNCIDGSKIGKK